MKYVPKSVTRIAGNTALKLRATSPTILVVTGVVGFGVTAVMAAKASRKAEKPIEEFHKERFAIQHAGLTEQQEKSEIIALYRTTGLDLAKVYGPTVVVGTLSAASILYGHQLLSRRHVATMLAYSGLQEQFLAYRGRVAKTIGEKLEEDIYNGAHGEWVEDPDHKGEYKLEPIWDGSLDHDSYLRPWFDEANPNWTRDPVQRKMFLTSCQSYANNRLEIYGHVMLNEVLDGLGFPRQPEGFVAGWLRRPDGSSYIDFGLLASRDPEVIDFLEGRRSSVRLNFNIDGDVQALMLNEKYRGKELH